MLGYSAVKAWYSPPCDFPEGHHEGNLVGSRANGEGEDWKLRRADLFLARIFTLAIQLTAPSLRIKGQSA